MTDHILHLTDRNGFTLERVWHEEPYPYFEVAMFNDSVSSFRAEDHPKIEDVERKRFYTVKKEIHYYMRQEE